MTMVYVRKSRTDAEAEKLADAQEAFGQDSPDWEGSKPIAPEKPVAVRGKRADKNSVKQGMPQSNII